MWDNVKTHIKGAGKCLLSYFMAAVLAWAAYPLIMIVLIGYIKPDLCLSIYTLVTFLIYLVIGYQLMHGFGEKDMKPYGWARYPLKGLVCAAICYVIVSAVGCVIVFVADKYVVVHHPKFVIETLNGYLKLAVYMPFYWILRLVEGAPREICPVPDVTYLRALAAGLLTLPAPAFGYWMGFRGKRIFRGEVKNPLLRRLFYSSPKKKG